jgi:hypothetical protein
MQNEDAVADLPPGKNHLVIFMPFLRLEDRYSVAGVDFLPLREPNGNVPDRIVAADGALSTILSGYVDRHGNRFDNCVVASIADRGWDLDRTDGPAVMWAASLLFLAAWSRNEYFPRFGGGYVNSSMFRVTGQGYTGDLPVYIAVVARRRDGSSWDGGYRHGEFTFSAPPQCSVTDLSTVDSDFLAALDRAHSSDSLTMQRLRTALPFVQLANSDDDMMVEDAEAILMGSAFEQLLAGDASSYKLGRKLGALLHAAGTVSVADAQKTRPDIQIEDNPKYPERTKEQPRWWVHRKWVEELYDLRSKFVHKGDHTSRKWAWTVNEHLVMAAFVFPLAVKLLLQKEGFYSLNDEDKSKCAAIDKLLATTEWGTEDSDSGDGCTWHRIVSSARLDQDFDRRMAAYLKAHPDLFGDAAD